MLDVEPGGKPAVADEIPATTPAVPWWRRPGLIALALGAAGLLYRVAMTLVEIPEPDSDEAIIGIAAIKIAQLAEFPIWYYGQVYLGMIDSYAAAPLIGLFGPSVGALRVPLLIFYALFVFMMYQFTRRVFTPWLAVVTVGLLALGSERILHNQLLSGGYPEMNVAGALLMLIPVLIGFGAVRRRYPWYALWGLTAGLMVWVDWLVAPYALVGAVLLIAAAWYDGLRRLGLAWAALVTTIAGIVGALPMIYYNLFLAAPGADSFSAFLELGRAHSELNPSLFDRVRGGLVIGISMGTGMCTPKECQDWQFGYSVAYLVLLLAAGLLALAGLRRVRTRRLAGDDAKHAKLRHLARLGLVLASAATIGSYVLSASSVWYPNASSRYLSCLIISTPAIIWPFWVAARSARRWLSWGGRAGLATLTAMSAYATFAVFANLPELRSTGHRQDQLIAALDARGITRVYSEYWTCNIIVFKSGERIICAELYGLDLGRNRYEPYVGIVAAEPRPAYIVPHRTYEGAGRSDAIDKRLLELGMTSEMFTVAGYDVYLPPIEFSAKLPARQ